MKFAITLIAFGVSIGAIGYATYMVAPAGSDAKTAVFVTGGIGGLAIVCALMSLLIRVHRTVGMIGIHLGMIVPLLAAGGPAMQFGKSLDGAKASNEPIATIVDGDIDPAVVAFTKTEVEGEEVWTGTLPSALDQDMGGLLAPKGYQTVGIAASGIVCIFGFIAVLLHRPKVPKKAKTESE
mgnify:CR=1 FL=1